jgi:hypothetical protein
VSPFLFALQALDLEHRKRQTVDANFTNQNGGFVAHLVFAAKFCYNARGVLYGNCTSVRNSMRAGSVQLFNRAVLMNQTGALLKEAMSEVRT